MTSNCKPAGGAPGEPESGPSRRIKSPKLAELIANDLRTQVVKGLLQEGDQLPKLERLAQRFGVSLAVVREALRVLETENLLEIRRGAKGGVMVKAPSLEIVARSVGLYLQHQRATIDDVLTARLAIEPFAAAALAAKPSPGVAAALTAHVDRSERDVNDPVRFANANAAFHHAVVELSGNKTLSLLHAAIVRIVQAELTSINVRWDSLVVTLNNRHKVIRSCHRLINIIEAGEPTAAERHWRRHLEEQAKVLLSVDDGKLVIDLFAGADETAPADGWRKAAHETPAE